MNERIRLLAQQADEGYTGDSKDDMGASLVGNDAIEKFAELIVAECIEVCRQGKYGRKDDLDTIQFDNGIRFCINAIDEHFGD